jgi:hypothetical protein
MSTSSRFHLYAHILVGRSTEGDGHQERWQAHHVALHLRHDIQGFESAFMFFLVTYR